MKINWNSIFRRFLLKSLIKIKKILLNVFFIDTPSFILSKRKTQKTFGPIWYETPETGSFSEYLDGNYKLLSYCVHGDIDKIRQKDLSQYVEYNGEWILFYLGPMSIKDDKRYKLLNPDLRIHYNFDSGGSYTSLYGRE